MCIPAPSVIESSNSLIIRYHPCRVDERGGGRESRKPQLTKLRSGCWRLITLAIKLIGQAENKDVYRDRGGIFSRLIADEALLPCPQLLHQTTCKALAKYLKKIGHQNVIILIVWGIKPGSDYKVELKVICNLGPQTPNLYMKTSLLLSTDKFPRVWLKEEYVAGLNRLLNQTLSQLADHQHNPVWFPGNTRFLLKSNHWPP